MNRTESGFAVGASPFNAVKLELGLILVICVAILVAVDSITENVLIQVLILAVSGLSGFGWLFWRTRVVVAKMKKDKQQPLENKDSTFCDGT